MSDIVIHAKDLTKVYRLYTSPRYRFLGKGSGYLQIGASVLADRLVGFA